MHKALGINHLYAFQSWSFGTREEILSRLVWQIATWLVVSADP